MSAFKEELYEFERLTKINKQLGYFTLEARDIGHLNDLRNWMKDMEGLRIVKRRDYDTAIDNFFIAFEQDGVVLNGVELSIKTVKTHNNKKIMLDIYNKNYPSNIYEVYK